HALLAGDDDVVEPGPVAAIVDGHDVEPRDVDFAIRDPRHEPCPPADGSIKFNAHLLDPALAAVRWIPARVRERTEVAGVTDPVAVGVGLARVGNHRTVVRAVVDPVTIAVAELPERQGRTTIAGIPGAIMVGIGLVGIRDEWTVITGVADAIAVRVLLRR